MFLGWANNRLVEGTTAALQHNLGLGGAVVVTVYKRADGKKCAPVSSEEVGKKNKLGYNPAVEAKGFTKKQADSVRSKTKASEWYVSQLVNFFPRDRDIVVPAAKSVFNLKQNISQSLRLC